jgi:hypothetical protein
MTTIHTQANDDQLDWWRRDWPLPVVLILQD